MGWPWQSSRMGSEAKQQGSSSSGQREMRTRRAGHGAEHPAVPWVLLRRTADPRRTQVSVSAQLISWEIMGTVNTGG